MIVVTSPRKIPCSSSTWAGCRDPRRCASCPSESIAADRFVPDSERRDSRRIVLTAELSSGGALLRDAREAVADRVGVVAEVVQARQGRERVEREHPLEEGRRPVAHCAADSVVAACLGDEATLEQPRDRRVRRYAADPRDLRPRDRPQVRDDRDCLERGLRQTALHGTLEQARARFRCIARSAECPAASDALQDDAAPSFAVALAEQSQRGLDPVLRLTRCVAELFGRQRRRCDDEQSFDDPRERIERVGGDQAERTFHEWLLSTLARAILIGANGAACWMAISSCLRSSSSARNATAISTRDIPATS